MAVYKFSLSRPNYWAELALGLPSTFMGLLLGVRYYYLTWFMPIIGIMAGDAIFTIVYRYAFYKIAWNGSDELDYPGWRFYVLTLLIQVVPFGLVLIAYFRYYLPGH